ncbi:hypothetical protein [Paenibacillus sp. NPDC058071]
MVEKVLLVSFLAGASASTKQPLKAIYAFLEELGYAHQSSF